MKNVIFADEMKRKILLIPVLLMAALRAEAQEAQPSWLARMGLDYLHSLTAPKKSLDSVYVFQPTLKWTVSVESEILRIGADLHSTFSVTDLTGDNPSITQGTLDTGMKNLPYRKVGLAGGYGSLRLGFGVQLGKKSGKKNTYLSFGMTNPSYGARARYYKIHPYPEGTLVYGDGAPVSLASEIPGEMRTLALDAFYAFNRHRFVYTAVYDGRILQRRSAGSWLVAAKYLQGDVSLGENDPLWARLNNQERYSTRQFSLGGGYSFNWVLFHQDPTEPSTASGLRNLTLNATLQCRLSFLNHVQTVQAAAAGGKTVRYTGQPALAPAAQGGLCYSLGRCCFCASVEYDYFGFQGIETDASAENDHLRTRVRTEGTFYNLTVQGKVSVRF